MSSVAFGEENQSSLSLWGCKGRSSAALVDLPESVQGDVNTPG